MQPQQKVSRYTIPRFHNMALIVLSYGPLEITVRQLTLILLSIILGYNLFRLDILPLVLRAIMIALVVVVVLPFGFVNVAGRTLDTWLLVLLRYRLQPKICIWRRLPERSTKSKENA